VKTGRSRPTTFTGGFIMIGFAQTTTWFYDPSTGFNLNPTKVDGQTRGSRRFSRSIHPNAAGAINDALQMELRKRMSFGLTLGASYTFARLKDSTSGPVLLSEQSLQFFRRVGEFGG